MFALLLYLVGLCSVAALVIGIVAINQIQNLRRKIESKETFRATPQRSDQPAPPLKSVPKAPEPVPLETLSSAKQMIQTEKVLRKSLNEIPKPPDLVSERRSPDSSPKASADSNIEQTIGTRWILIAGIVTVMVGMVLFLKFASERFALGPYGKIIAGAICGFAALVLGEVTRRRGYDIVAKGVTALGFAILYAVVFCSYRVYDLIDLWPCFILAIFVTIGAMSYAVALDERLMAFLSLLGGFLTPLIVSSGVNAPVSLFSYVLVLSIGAMGCAYYRRWRVVNLLAFLGTFLLYAGWFENFYRPAMRVAAGAPGQMPIALLWLGIFFGLYLVLPLMYGLLKKARARMEDVILVFANVAVIFFYLSSILYDDYRGSLALSSLVICAVHLAMMFVVSRRCAEDKQLQEVLLAIGLFFLTVAAPLYFKLHATAVAWAGEGVILTVIGMKYNSRLTRSAGVVALMLSVLRLMWDGELSLHYEQFRLIFNPQFGSWCFVAAAGLTCHFLYRRDKQLPEHLRQLNAQLFYVGSILLLFFAAGSEWWAHCKYNLADSASADIYFSRGMITLFAIVPTFFTVRRLTPAGLLVREAGCLVSLVGAIYTVIRFSQIHSGPFSVFFNVDFALAILFVMSIFAAVWLHGQLDWGTEAKKLIVQLFYAAAVVLFFVIVATEWWANSSYNLAHAPGIDQFNRGMILMFAAFPLLFAIRPLCPQGDLVKAPGYMMWLIGAFFTTIIFWGLHHRSFLIFANIDFTVSLLFTLSLFLGAWIYSRSSQASHAMKWNVLGLLLLGIFVFWILLTQEIYLYWSCKNHYAGPIEDWRFMANMFVSIMWGLYGLVLMGLGFWKKFKILRYIALGLFGLLLAKVFLFDMSTVESIYRIAAFMVTGLILVGVSYLYQYLHKKGFFETILAEKGSGQ